MALLKAILAKIDEVDEQFRGLYTQKGEKWEFTGVEGLKTQADIDRQLAANQKVRGDLSKAQGDLKAATDKLTLWEQELGDGVTVEDVKTKLDKLATLEAGSSVPELAKNFEATVNSRVETVLAAKLKQETAKLNRTIEEQKTALATAQTSIQTFETQNNQRTVHDAVRAAAVAAKVLPDAVGDLLVLSTADLKLVDGKVQTDDGRDPSAWLEDRKTKTPYFWAAAQGTGSRGSDGGPGATGDNPFTRGNHNMTKISQLVSTNPAQAAKFAEQAGVPKDATGNYQWHIMPAEQKK